MDSHLKHSSRQTWIRTRTPNLQSSTYQKLLESEALRLLTPGRTNKGEDAYTQSVVVPFRERHTNLLWKGADDAEVELDEVVVGGDV